MDSIGRDDSPRSFEIRCEPGTWSRWVLTVERSGSRGDVKVVLRSLLAIEQRIDDDLRTLGDDLAGVWTAASTRMQSTSTTWFTMSCGSGQSMNDDPEGHTHLCIGCLEARLGRRLTANDFTDVGINWADRQTRSDRLRDRLDRP